MFFIIGMLVVLGSNSALSNIAFHLRFYVSSLNDW